MKTAAVYIRVSTEDQTEYSPDAQWKLAKAFAASHNLILDEKYLYRDDGISGRHAKKRPAFNEMIAAAKTKPTPFQVILLWKFSRFARNQEESIVYKSMLRKDGIEVISISEPLAEGPFGTLIERIIEWMDEYYSIRLGGEVTRGMTEKASRGEFQTAAPFGYEKHPGQPLTIVQEEAKYVRFIFDQFFAGSSFFAIARALNSIGIRTKRGNPFENRTVEYILNNPIYKGYVRWTPAGKMVSRRIFDSPDTIVKKSDHKPIIEEDLFDSVQKKLLTSRSHNRRGMHPVETKKHYLSGILRCGSCGATLTYSKSSDGFQCVKYAHGSCKASHFIKAEQMEQTILSELNRICTDYSYHNRSKNVLKYLDQKKELLTAESAALKKALDRSKRAYLSGIDSLEEYEANKTTLQRELEKNQLALSNAAADPKEESTSFHLIKSAAALLRSDISLPIKHAAVASIVEKITFDRSSSEIIIYFYR